MAFAGFKPVFEFQVLGVLLMKLTGLALDGGVCLFPGVPCLLLGDLDLLAVVLDLLGGYRPRLPIRCR